MISAPPTLQPGMSTAPVHTLHVITGLVPVIPMWRSAAPPSIGMAGTSPAMTTEGVTKAGVDA
jgi:hypothetical protein